MRKKTRKQYERELPPIYPEVVQGLLADLILKLIKGENEGCARLVESAPTLIGKPVHTSREMAAEIRNRYESK